MNSIKKNQPEHNRSDLAGGEAVEQIRAIVKKAQTCFFRTAVALGDTGGIRPMSVQRVDDDGLHRAHSHLSRKRANTSPAPNESSARASARS